MPDTSAEHTRSLLLDTLNRAGWQVGAYGFSGIRGIHESTGESIEIATLRIHSADSQGTAEIRRYFDIQESIAGQNRRSL
jgi:hypothetical protein